VQFIVSGHTHSLVKTVVNGIPIVQSRSSGTAYSIADLVQRSDGSREWRTRVETLWADRVTPNASVEAIVATYRPEVDRRAREVVATLRDSLLERREVLGNLIADAQRHAAPGIDFALMNRGGVRRDLYPGPLTYNDLFELQPFANNVVVVQLSGAQLRDVMEKLVGGSRPGGYVSGLVIVYDPTRKTGERILELKRSDGAAIVPGDSYRLALTDYLQGGGDGFAMLRLLPYTRSGKTDLEALVDYLRREPQPVGMPDSARIRAVPPA